MQLNSQLKYFHLYILLFLFSDKGMNMKYEEIERGVRALNRADADLQREKVCACWERETTRSRGSQLQMHNIFICYTRIHKKHVQLGQLGIQVCN